MTMATHFIPAKGSPLPLNLLWQAVPQLSRGDLEALTERLIDRLDQIDGDNDVEPNGDELDGSNAEDDWGSTGGWRPGGWSDAGCPISDPDCAVDDYGCDDREQGDIAEDVASHLAPCRYGADQREVLGDWGPAYRHD